MRTSSELKGFTRYVFFPPFLRIIGFFWKDISTSLSWFFDSVVFLCRLVSLSPDAEAEVDL